MADKQPEQREWLDLRFSDEELISALKGRITRSQDFYNSKHKLKDRRVKLDNYYRGKHDANQDLYDYQTPYTENLMYMQIEHATNALNAKVAEPVIEAKNKSNEAKQATEQFSPFLRRWVELQRVIDLARVATRHNLLKFVGILKVRWDPFAGPVINGYPIGDVVVEVTEPENVVFDHTTRYFQEPSMIAERRYEPLENAIQEFPDKKAEILRHYNLKGTGAEMSRTICFWEVHFTYWEDTAKPQQGIAWFSEDLNFVFGKTRNPLWDEDGVQDDEAGTINFRNILDHPAKPYATLSSTSLGKGVIDDTSPAEQIIPLLDIIDKRGRQITQAGDDVRGGWAFSEDFIDRDEAAELINDPLQSIWGKGDVDAGAKRLPPPPLPNYVLRGQVDARRALDNIFGFHGTSRGEREGTDQPTTIQLLKEGDFERQDGMVAGIDRLMEKTYQLIAHLMALKYTDEHWQHYGLEGGANLIKHVKNVYVKAGTTLPTDKLSQREEAKELMALGKIDYESFFERVGWPNPKEAARKLFRHETNPLTLYRGQDPSDVAAEHIEIIRQGRTPIVPDEITDQYVAQMNNFMRDTNRFNQLTTDAQAVFASYMQTVVETAQQRAELLQLMTPAQPPTEEGGQPPQR